MNESIKELSIPIRSLYSELYKLPNIELRVIKMLCEMILDESKGEENK